MSKQHVPRRTLLLGSAAIAIAPAAAFATTSPDIGKPAPAFTAVDSNGKTWSLADLGIDPAAVGLDAAWTKVTDVTQRPPRQQGLIVTDDGNGGAVLAQFLAMQKFV